MAHPGLTLVRRAGAVLYHRGDALTVLSPRGAHRLEGDTAALARALLDALRAPRPIDDLVTMVVDRTGEPRARCEPMVRALLEVLERAGAVGSPGPERERGDGISASKKSARVVLGVSGAVAAAFAPELCQRLLSAGFEVQVVLTRAAGRFVSWRALEALTHRPVVRSLWQGTAGEPAPHIALARWAELVLVHPASASTLARLAAGDASDALSATVLATRAPVVLAPSMNDAMFEAPAVQRNLALLQSDGRILVEPTVGHEVADTPGSRTLQWGPAPTPERMVEVARSVLSSAPREARTPSVSAVQDAAPTDWEALYAGTPEGALPWTHERLDEDLAEALARFAPASGAALELGCGTGVDALALVSWGYAVTAVDGAATALERAKARPGADKVRWVHAPLEQWAALGEFALLLDRACLHTLEPSRRALWADAVRAVTAVGSVLLLKTHHAEVGRSLGTWPLGRAQLASLFGEDFRCLYAAESTVPGALAPPPRAELTVWRRER